MFIFGKKFGIVAGRILRLAQYDKNGKKGIAVTIKNYKGTEYTIFFTNAESKDFVKRFQKAGAKADDVICCYVFAPQKDADETKLAGIDFELMFESGFHHGRIFSFEDEKDRPISIYFGKVANPRDGKLGQFYISGKTQKDGNDNWISFSFWDTEENGYKRLNATNARKVLKKGDIVCIYGGKVQEKEYLGKISPTVSALMFSKF